MPVTTYHLRIACPRCPNRQVVTLSFSNPSHISYECQNCKTAWETPERHRAPAVTP